MSGEKAPPRHDESAAGYDTHAGEFMLLRTPSRVGVSDVRAWARTLPRPAEVLDLGCGHGVPISQALLDEGLDVFAVDASPTLLAAFRARFPGVPTECGPAEESPLFGRFFDGILAWGLVFLLGPDQQVALIERAASVLRPGGRFLFTSPAEVCRWRDVVTGRTSVSLGADAYIRCARGAGMVLEREWEDEGQNHYYAFLHPGDAGR